MRPRELRRVAAAVRGPPAPHASAASHPADAAGAVPRGVAQPVTTCAGASPSRRVARAPRAGASARSGRRSSARASSSGPARPPAPRSRARCCSWCSRSSSSMRARSGLEPSSGRGRHAIRGPPRSVGPRGRTPTGRGRRRRATTAERDQQPAPPPMARRRSGRRGVDHRVRALREDRRDRVGHRLLLDAVGHELDHVDDGRRVEEDLERHLPDRLHVAVAHVERGQQHRHAGREHARAATSSGNISSQLARGSIAGSEHEDEHDDQVQPEVEQRVQRHGQRDRPAAGSAPCAAGSRARPAT